MPSAVATINGSFSCYDGLDDDAAADVRARQGITPVGVDLRVVEPGTTRELPWDDEASGEVQVRGPWIASGYYRLPASEEWITAGAPRALRRSLQPP